MQNRTPSIRKKARKGSDDEDDHGEGDGESEKEYLRNTKNLP